MEKRYQIPIKNWKDITKETADLYFREADKMLKETLDSFKALGDKAFQVLRIYIIVLFALLGSFIAFFANNFDYVFHTFSILCLIFIIPGMYHVYNAIYTAKLSTTGSQPKLLIHQGHIKEQPDKNEQYLFVIINAIENHQQRIGDNLYINAEKTKHLSKGLKWIAIRYPLIVLAIILVVMNLT